MKNKNVITKGTAICLVLLIAGSLAACKADPEDTLSSTRNSSSVYNDLLAEEYSGGESSSDESSAEYETLENGEVVTNEDGQKVTKAPIGAENNNEGNKDSDNKNGAQEQPTNDTVKPNVQPTQPKPTQPKPTNPPDISTTTTKGDGKVTQAQRNYMTNKFIEKALAVGFTTAKTDNTGAITGNYSGEVDKVTPENYGIIYDGWMNSGGIEACHKYMGYNKLYVEWKDCGDYWEIYLKFDK